MTLQEQIDSLKKELEELRNLVYKNNFSTKQYFDKSLIFNSTIEAKKRAVFAEGLLNITVGQPATCEVGDICLDSGSLYACFTTNNWTLIGPAI